MSMEKLFSNIQDTAICLHKQEETMDFSFKTLVEHGDKLRSFLILYMLASKTQEALNQMKPDVPGIEKRLCDEIEDVCRQSKEVITGLKTHLDWIKEIMDALGDLCKGSDLATRHTDLHKQIVEMEKTLSVLIEKRNKYPITQI